MQLEEYTNGLYHYGVKGMKWGVRKKTNVGRQVKRLNRINTSTEKHATINRVLSDRIEKAKKSKNPLKKLVATSYIADRKYSEVMYNRGKKKVDEILADLERNGVTLKELEKRKWRPSAGISYDFIARWGGIEYAAIDQSSAD